MVVDLVDSTASIAAVPMAQMEEMMTAAVSPMRGMIESCGGRIVKFTGDGYLATFPSATGALHSATQIVQFFESRGTAESPAFIAGCRIALNTCDVTLFENDVLSEGVVVAARMEKYVPINSVYLSAATMSAAKSGEFNFEEVAELELDGIPLPIKAYRLLTEEYRGVERGRFLVVTDLIGLSQWMAEATLADLNKTLRTWIGLHRRALAETSGRMRAVAGDNVIVTHAAAHESLEFVDRLDAMVAEHNRVGDGFAIGFSAFVGFGDLYVPDFGVAGPLVSQSFQWVNRLPPNTRAISADVAARLEPGRWQDRLDELRNVESDGRIYRLTPQ
ncbi:adenylate/guanylate cyclase domain-containing protein [Micromonospora carbonacea]|uniref:adenylate/guanylate cyclase domain-containing protein n=1 Tax=Micromonospora carbonacea TaxID=47853 RepID=UPI003711205D